LSGDQAILPRSLANEGDMMKTLTYAAVVLAAIAGAAPAMAQAVQPPAPLDVQAQTPPAPQELAPVVGWSGMPGQADGAYNGYGQPNQVYGMPGAGQASASSHPAP
jgi:hypothetical protein